MDMQMFKNRKLSNYTDAQIQPVMPSNNQALKMLQTTHIHN